MQNIRHPCQLLPFLLLFFPLSVFSQQDQANLNLYFAQDRKNFSFNAAVPLEDRIPIYDSEDPEGPARVYADKGELLEAVDELQWSVFGEEYRKLIVVMHSNTDRIGYVDATKVALFREFDPSRQNLGIRKRVITGRAGTQVVVIEHHDLVGYIDNRFTVSERFYNLRRTGFGCFLVEDVNYSDHNGDGKGEFVVRGTYKGGYFFSDSFRFKVEEWYDLDATLPAFRMVLRLLFGTSPKAG